MRINPTAIVFIIFTTTVGFIGGTLLGNATLGVSTGLAVGTFLVLLGSIG